MIGPIGDSFRHVNEHSELARESGPFLERGECFVLGHSPLTHSSPLCFSRSAVVRDVGVRSIEDAQKKLGPEAQLVQRFCRWLLSQDIVFCRLELWSPESGAVLKTDLYCPEVKLLLEAKANISRESIRSAMGQLADYARFMPDVGACLGILIPRKPKYDLLRLLDSHAIACIYEGSDGQFRLARTVGGSVRFALDNLEKPFSPSVTNCVG